MQHCTAAGLPADCLRSLLLLVSFQGYHDRLLQPLHTLTSRFFSA